MKAQIALRFDSHVLKELAANVEPFDFTGGTEGRTIGEAEFMAADWLKTMLDSMDIDGEKPPAPTFGNAPRHNGKVMCIGVTAGKDAIEKVTASEAARRLGVTPGRVTQMLDAGQLSGWREGHRTWVTLDSVKARIEEKPRSGRPPRKRATA